MTIPPSLLHRLAGQLDAVDLILERGAPELLDARPPSGDWSARENLAHLARHHAVFLDRVRRLLAEDRPALGRYRAEEDPGWPAWSALEAGEAVRRLRTLRAELVELVRGLTPAQARRTGIHPAFGELDLAGWLEFALLHEAHHLYTALVRVGEAAGRRGRAGPPG
jgi:hypothetical protein